MKTLVKDVVSLFNNTDWERLKQHREIYSVDGSLKVPNVHVADVTELFEDCDYIAIPRNSEKYPIELSVIIQGVKFFSIHSLEEFTHES